MLARSETTTVSMDTALINIIKISEEKFTKQPQQALAKVYVALEQHVTDCICLW